MGDFDSLVGGVGLGDRGGGRGEVEGMLEGGIASGLESDSVTRNELVGVEEKTPEGMRAAAVHLCIWIWFVVAGWVGIEMVDGVGVGVCFFVP